MSSSVIPGRSFDRESPVTAYWLARCEGFGARIGGRRGVVEQVALAADAPRASLLVVRLGLRRHVVPATAVDAVVPAERLLVLRSPGRPVEHVPAERAVRIGAAFGRAVARGAVVFAVSVALGAALLVRLARVYGRRALDTLAGVGADAAASTSAAVTGLASWAEVRRERARTEQTNAAGRGPRRDRMRSHLHAN